jgi:hypothetical protein
MASNKSWLQKPITWIVIAGIGVAAFALTEPEPTKSSGIKALSKKKSSSKSGDSQFTKEDYEAVFKPVNDKPKNSFVPIVARHGGIGSADGLANAIPIDMTGGEPNWIYTGSAETDGVPTALIENRTSGDAVFLKRGERWKSSFVERITPYSVVLRGPNGTKTLGLVDEDTSSKTIARASSGFSPAPVDVPSDLRGPIGGGRRNRGMNGLQALPDPTMGQHNGFGVAGQNDEE